MKYFIIVLLYLILTDFDTRNVTIMEGMFCFSLIDINFSNFNMSKVTNMRSIFYGCSSLVNINLSIFNTSNIVNMT